ncbi:MAG: methyltransferase [Bacteroidetes bacterium]|nr:methyltransferase [Bacteroidota bacterium]
MQTVIKHIVSRTYKPLVQQYLSKTRIYTYKGLKLTIRPEVFHPGFFSSTQLLLQFLLKQPVDKKNFLELGCGSGLISMVIAGKGARVTATDINPIATAQLIKNCKQNNCLIQVIESNLFGNIPLQQFDIIAINPPYYKRNPQQPKEYAWFCGEDGSYFSGLFSSLAQYMHDQTNVYMILCDGCDMVMINTFAAGNGFTMDCVFEKRNLVEKNFIFKISKKTSW